MLDDFSLCTTIAATDVSDTLQAALGEWLENKGIRHIRGRAYHPMTQGKIEQYRRSMKKRILLENYYLPGQLEQSIGEFVEYYNNRRHHESLDNLTPADVYFDRGPAILKTEGKPSNERPSNKDAACTSRQSQPEPSNQMSQILS